MSNSLLATYQALHCDNPFNFFNGDSDGVKEGMAAGRTMNGLTWLNMDEIDTSSTSACNQKKIMPDKMLATNILTSFKRNDIKKGE